MVIKKGMIFIDRIGVFENPFIYEIMSVSKTKNLLRYRNLNSDNQYWASDLDSFIYEIEFGDIKPYLPYIIEKAFNKWLAK